MLNLNDGYKLVRFVREVLECYLKGKKVTVNEGIKNSYNKPSGVFVTLNKVTKELRGCIGYPYAIKPLYQALIECTISAANDPRFRKVELEEIDSLIIELSILTEPTLIRVKDPKEYPKMIKVGRDGLIVKRGYISGLLLPQVAVEYGWDEETFLCETCIKAGLLPDCWLYKDTEVYKFQAIIFKEVRPNGEVIMESLLD